LPQPLSAKDLLRGQSEILNVRRIRRINRQPVESDDDSAPERISDTDDGLNWNRDFDQSLDSEEDCSADNESHIEQDNGIEDPECPEEQDVSAVPNVPGLVRLTQKSTSQAEWLLMTVNAAQTRKNKGGKKK